MSTYRCVVCSMAFEYSGKGVRLYCDDHVGGTIERTCPQCGDRFRAAVAPKNAHHGIYCSVSCSNKARRQALSERFWAQVDRRGSDGCWPFIGGRDRDGYGLITEGRRQLRAPRVAYEIQNGPIPSGSIVMHSCDNTWCCNGAHLSLGTTLQNNRDKAARGRSTKSRTLPKWDEESKQRQRLAQAARRERERREGKLVDRQPHVPYAMSQEQRQRLSDAMKAAWQRRKDRAKAAAKS
jgi:hypothetical protein